MAAREYTRALVERTVDSSRKAFCLGSTSDHRTSMSTVQVQRLCEFPGHFLRVGHTRFRPWDTLDTLVSGYGTPLDTLVSGRAAGNFYKLA